MSGPAVPTDLADAARSAFATAFGGALRLIPDTGPGVLVDGRTAPPQISPDDPSVVEGPGRCLVRGGRETLLRCLESERLFASAFVSGRLRISGDMSVLARIDLGRAS